MPHVAEVHLAKGRIHFDQDRLDDAAAAAQKALSPASSPFTRAKAYTLWGDVLKEKGDAEGAIEKYKEAVETAPEFIPAHNKLGATYEALGQLDLALEAYKKAVAQDPGAPEAHYNLGNVHQSLEDFAHAEAEYKKAIRLGPEPTARGRTLQAKAHTNLGGLYYAQKRYEQAFRQLLLAVDFDESLIESRILLGSTYVQLKHLEQAKNEFKAALKIDPENQYAKEALEALDTAISKAKSKREETHNP